MTQKVRGVLAAMLMALVLTACTDPTESASEMPAVTGERLDEALSDIERSGYDDRPDIVGGGTFGVIDESNWIVCGQEPAEGEVIEDPRLVVDRECESADEQQPETDDSSAETTDGVEPTEETTTTTEVEDTTATSAGEVVDPDAVLARILEIYDSESIEDLCSAVLDAEGGGFAYSFWACLFHDVTATASYLNLELVAGGLTAAEAESIAEDAGRNWFGLIECDFGELHTIVVTVEGLDHNIYRRDVPIASDEYCG